MGDAGRKIIEGLKDAIAGNLAAVTIDGQRWVRDDGWQPIETAPKDGTEVLGFYRGCRVIVKWHPFEEAWVSPDLPNTDDIRGYAVLDLASWRGHPCVWRPLPARPLPAPPPDTVKGEG